MKDNYHDLFTNPWCPLLGDLSDFNETRYNIPNSQVTRCVKIIEKSRGLWGVNPRYMADTNWPEEKAMPAYRTMPSPIVNKAPIVIPQYPFWKVEDARTIVRTRIQVHQYILEPGGAPSPTPDIAWEETLRIVRDWSMKMVNEKTTDSEILAALAIAEAWNALGDILYYGEKEEAPEVLKTIQIASGLLTKAQELASKELIKNKEQILQDQKDDIEKKDVTVTALQKALIEKQDVIHSTEKDKGKGSTTIEHYTDVEEIVEDENISKTNSKNTKGVLLKFDTKHEKVYFDGHLIFFNMINYRILLKLARTPGKLVKNTVLYDYINSDHYTPLLLTQRISIIRKSFPPPYSILKDTKCIIPDAKQNKGCRSLNLTEKQVEIS